MGVSADGRVGRYGNSRSDPPRVVRAELEINNFPDADTIEQHPGTLQQARYGIFKLDVIHRPFAEATSFLFWVMLGSLTSIAYQRFTVRQSPLR